jgi:hypothetical protein
LSEVDLATGAKRGFTIDGGGVSATYTRPTGQGIVLSTFVGPQQGWTLERVDLSGARQLTFPTDQLGPAGTYNGGYLESPDGTQLVLGAANGLVVMGNDGAIARRLQMPGPLPDCRPVRWWTAAVVLARCDPGAASSTSQLWRVPVSGGAPTALTAVNTGQADSGFGNDLGDTDAWQVPAGTFLQSEAGCGAGFLSRLACRMPCCTPIRNWGTGLVLEIKPGFACGSGGIGGSISTDRRRFVVERRGLR